MLLSWCLMVLLCTLLQHQNAVAVVHPLVCLAFSKVHQGFKVDLVFVLLISSYTETTPYLCIQS